MSARAAVARALDRARRTKGLVEVRHGRSWSRGIVVGCSESLVVLQLVDDSGRFDGWRALPREQVTRVDSEPEQAELYARVLRRRRLRPSLPRGLRIESLPELARSAGRRFPLLTIERERTQPGACEIGAHAGQDERELRLDLTGVEGVIDGIVVGFRFRSLTSLGFGGRYEQALAAIAARRGKRSVTLELMIHKWDRVDGDALRARGRIAPTNPRTVHRALLRACEGRRLARLWRSRIERQRIDAFVLELSKELVLVQPLGDDFRLDGWLVLRIVDLTHVDLDPAHLGRWDRALALMGERRARPRGLRLSDLAGTLESASVLSAIELYRERSKRASFLVGADLEVGERSVSFREIDPEGELQGGRTRVPLRALTKLAFGTGYLDALRLGARRGLG